MIPTKAGQPASLFGNGLASIYRNRALSGPVKFEKKFLTLGNKKVRNSSIRKMKTKVTIKRETLKETIKAGRARPDASDFSKDFITDRKQTSVSRILSNWIEKWQTIGEHLVDS